MTVQILDGIPAVLSVGKLCEEPGKTYEWASGQKPQLTKQGKKIQGKTDNVVPKMGKYFCASRKSSFPLLSQNCRQAPAQVRLLRPSPKKHRVPVWVQQDYEVTKLILKRWETDAMIQKSKTIKMRSTIEQRETACDTSRNGWRSSQIISKIQKCQHSQTLLMTQIRNVLRKWQPGTKNPKPNKDETTIERGDPLCSDIPEWLQEFRKIDRVPEHRDSHASSSHELSLEPTSTRSEDLGKHSIYTHFSKDRNCEACKRTKMTRRTGEAVPRAEKLVT